MPGKRMAKLCKEEKKSFFYKNKFFVTKKGEKELYRFPAFVDKVSPHRVNVGRLVEMLLHENRERFGDSEDVK